MSNTDPWMSDAAVADSVDNVGRTVFTKLRPGRRARRSVMSIGAVLAGLGLFAGGIAFGAEANAGAGAPTSFGTPLAVPKNLAFSVACYPVARSDQSDALTSQQFTNSSPALLEQAKADPAATCQPSLHSYLATEKFGFAIRSEHLAGHNCGVLNIAGVAPFYFGYQVVRGLPEYHGTFKPPATPLAPSCVTVFLPAVPLTSSMLTACKVDPQHAIVYILDGASAAATCEKNGYTLWN